MAFHKNKSKLKVWPAQGTHDTFPVQTEIANFLSAQILWVSIFIKDQHQPSEVPYPFLSIYSPITQGFQNIVLQLRTHLL